MMAREVRRQTLKWKKEQAEKEKSSRVEAQNGIFCKSQGMKIDRATCIVMQTRKFDNCIGCRSCGIKDKGVSHEGDYEDYIGV